MPPETEEKTQATPSGLADLIQSAVAEFRSAVVRQDEEIKKHGEASGETVAMIEKLNARLDDLDLKMQQASIPSPAVSDADGGSATPEAKERKAVFLKWCRGGLGVLEPAERKALVEDATGQYLVTEELDAEIVRTLPKITVMRGLATQRSIGSDRIKMRSLGEVSVGWGKLETGTDPEESEPTPGVPTYQYIENLQGLAKIGVDELADSDFALESIFADSFSRALGEAEDLAFFRGAGHDSDAPEGVCINATLVAATVTTTVAAAVTIEKFLEMVYTCPTQYRRNGEFVVNSTTELFMRQLRSLTGLTYEGPFMWQPSVQAGRPNTFLGYPIHTQDDMKELSDTAEVIGAFGDWKAGYRIIDRKGITIQRLTELYAEAGLVGFLATKRVGGSAMRAAQKPIVLLTEA